MNNDIRHSLTHFIYILHNTVKCFSALKFINVSVNIATSTLLMGTWYPIKWNHKYSLRETRHNIVSPVLFSGNISSWNYITTSNHFWNLSLIFTMSFLHNAIFFTELSTGGSMIHSTLHLGTGKTSCRLSQLNRFFPTHFINDMVTCMSFVNMTFATNQLSSYTAATNISAHVKKKTELLALTPWLQFCCHHVLVIGSSAYLRRFRDRKRPVAYIYSVMSWGRSIEEVQGIHDDPRARECWVLCKSQTSISDIYEFLVVGDWFRNEEVNETNHSQSFLLNGTSTWFCYTVHPHPLLMTQHL